MWETADKHVNVAATSKGLSDKAIQMYNMEYFLLGLMLFAFWSIVAVYHVRIVKNMINGWKLVTLIIILIIIGAGAVAGLRQIYMQSNNRDNMMKLSAVYTKKYLLLAQRLRYITQEDFREAWDELNPQNSL